MKRKFTAFLLIMALCLLLSACSFNLDSIKSQITNLFNKNKNEISIEVVKTKDSYANEDEVYEDVKIIIKEGSVIKEEISLNDKSLSVVGLDDFSKDNMDVSVTYEGKTATFVINVTDEMISVNYNSSKGGFIRGEQAQSVKKNELTQTVTAVPNYGYEFSSWSDGVRTAARRDVATKNITYGAYFKPIEFLVTFYNESGTVNSIVKCQYGKVIATASIPVPEAIKGKIASGWINTFDNTLVDFTKPITANIDLKPNYLDQILSVKFYDLANKLIEEKQVVYNQSVIPATAPIVTGMKFVEWETNGLPFSDFNNIKENLSLYSCYESLKQTVNYYDSDVLINTEIVDYGSTINYIPLKEFNEFLYWVNVEDGLRYNNTITKDLNLRAEWHKLEVNTYTITINDGTVVLESYTMDEGTTIGALNAPQPKTGKNFTGYYYLNGSTEVLYNSASNMKINSDITFYCKWEDIYYNVVFNANSGEVTGVVTNTQSIIYNGLINAADIFETIPSSVSTQYNCVGWKLNDETFNLDTNIVSNLTLVAVWEIKTYKINFIPTENVTSNITNNSITLTCKEYYNVVLTLARGCVLDTLTVNGSNILGEFTVTNLGNDVLEYSKVFSFSDKSSAFNIKGTLKPLEQFTVNINKNVDAGDVTYLENESDRVISFSMVDNLCNRAYINKYGKLSINITPDYGYIINSVKLDGTDIAIIDNKIIIEEIDSNSTLVIEFIRRKYVVTINIDNYSGSATTATFQLASGGDLTPVTDIISEDYRYTINDISFESQIKIALKFNPITARTFEYYFNGVLVTQSSGTITTSAITGDTTITIKMK